MYGELLLRFISCGMDLAPLNYESLGTNTSESQVCASALSVLALLTRHALAAEDVPGQRILLGRSSRRVGP